MNEFCLGLLMALLRGSIVLCVMAVAVVLFLRFVPVTSARLRRLLWVAVIVQGCLLSRIPVTLPSSPYFSAIFPRHQIDRPEWELLRDEIEAEAKATDPAANSTPARRTNPESRVSWASVAILLWGLGITVIVIRAGWYYRQFLRHLPAADEVPSEWQAEWELLRQPAGLRCRCELYPTHEVGPLLCWRPGGYQLIVPNDVWRMMTSSQRLMVLRHELAHLQRGDIWKSFALRLLALPHWFNPLVWWVVQRFEDDAECACDEAVSRVSPTQAIEYARTLLLFAGSRRAMLLSPLATGGHGLADRIRRLIAPNSRKDSIMKKLAIVCTVLGISTFQLLRFELLAEDPPTGTASEGALSIAADRVFLFSAVDSSKGQSGHGTQAIVDVMQVLKDLTEFEQDREALKREIAQGEREAIEKQSEMGQLKEELKAASDDAKPALRDRLDVVLKEFETWKKKRAQEFLRMESEMYLKTHKNIQGEIALYAKEHGIRLVRKVDRRSEPQAGTTNASQPRPNSQYTLAIPPAATNVGTVTATGIGSLNVNFTPNPEGKGKTNSQSQSPSPDGKDAAVNLKNVAVNAVGETVVAGTVSANTTTGAVVHLASPVSTKDSVRASTDGSGVLIEPVHGRGILLTLTGNTLTANGFELTTNLSNGTATISSAPNEGNIPSATGVGNRPVAAAREAGIVVNSTPTEKSNHNLVTANYKRNPNASSPAVNDLQLSITSNDALIVESPQETMRKLAEKEVLYAEPGDELDITKEIVQRMNAKFAQDSAAKQGQ